MVVPATTSPREFEAVADAQLSARGRLHRVAPLICVAVTLVACLIQNVSANSTRANLFWDAAHYIDSARDLAACARHWLAGDTAACQDLVARAGHKVLLDGPVLPLLGAAVYLVLGRTPTYDNLVVFTVIQSLLQAIGALLAFLLVRRLTGSSRWGLAGGLAWGLYPAAVIATGVYMSETVTTVLLMSLTLIASSLVLSEGLSNRRNSYVLRAICLGALAGLLLVTKPALIFGAGWVGLLAVALTRTDGHRLQLVRAAALGFALIVTSWAAFTKCTTKQVFLTPQRVPTHNMVMGFDIETDGFGTGPGSALDELYREYDGPLPVAAALSKAHPAEVANLLLRKPERMWSLPWNDLRRTLMGVPALYLAWWHQLVVLGGVLGAIVVLSKPAAGTADGASHTAVERSAHLIAWSAVGLVLCHLVYVVFESIPRYGFTAMPFMVLLNIFLLVEAARHRASRQWLFWMLVPAGCWFALALDLIPYLVPISGSAAGAVWLESAIKMAMILAAAGVAGTALSFPGEVKVVRLVSVMAIALFGVATVAAHACNSNAVREWRCKLRDRQSACRQIVLPPQSHATSSPVTASAARGRESPDWAAVLLDADRNGASLRVSLNGRALEASPHSVYWYDERAYSTWADAEQKASLFRKPLESIRQWRVVHVPPSWLNLNGPNLIGVKPPPGGGAAVYGDYPPVIGKRRILSSAFAAGKVWSSVSSLEGRVLCPIPAAPVQARSWLSSAEGKELSDLSPSAGMQIGDYRLHLMLGYRRAPDAGENAEVESVKTFKAGLPEADFQPPLRGWNPAMPPAGQMPASGWHRCEVPVNFAGRGRSHLLIRLKGIVRAAGNSKSASVAVILQGPKLTRPLILPGALHTLTVNAADSSFAVTEEVPYWLPEHGLAAVQIEINSAPDLQFRDLTLEIEPVRRPDLSRDRVLIL